MIVYAITNGLAHDLRYEEDGYVLKLNERSIPGWGELPPIESLHTPEALAARASEDELAAKRSAALRAIEEQQLEAAILDPNAPLEVKEYAAAR